MEIMDICRICLCNALQMHSVSVFYKISPEKTVSQVITQIAPVEVFEEDPLPKFICINCYQVILSIESFQQQIVTSDFQLKQKFLESQTSLLNEKDSEESNINIKDDKDQEVLVKIEVEVDIKEEPYFNETENENCDESFAYSSEYIKEGDDSKCNELLGSKHKRKSYTCNLCGKVLLGLSRFKDHMISHSEDKPFVCDYCCKKFKRRKSLKEHLREFHKELSKGNENQCMQATVGGTMFIEPSVVDEVVIKEEVIEKELQLQKIDCHKSPEADILNVIENTGPGDNETIKHVCKICGLTFSRIFSLKRHIKKSHHTDKSYACHLCIKKFKCMSHITHHIKTCHESSFVQEKESKKCGKLVQKKQNHKHRLNFRCEFCAKTFYSQFSLKQHRNIHIRDEQLKCRLCKIIFKTQEQLKMHNEMHLRKLFGKYNCSFCGKSFEEKFSLRNHLETDHPEKQPFVCQICQTSFESWTSLCSHKKKFHNKKLQNCPKCNEVFTLRSLRAHLKRHENGEHDVKGYACKICGKNFRNFTLRKKHMVVHTGERNFSCKICNKSFTQKSSVTTHMKVHTDKREFTCNHCKKGFKLKHHLHAHITNKHDSENKGENTEGTPDSRILDEGNKSVSPQGS